MRTPRFHGTISRAISFSEGSLHLERDLGDGALSPRSYLKAAVAWSRASLHKLQPRPGERRGFRGSSTDSLQHQPHVGTSPNVSQRGRGAAKSSSIRRQRQLKIQKSSYGPFPAAGSPSAPRVFRFFVRVRHTTARLGVLPHSSRCSLPFSSAELRLATAGAPVGIAPGKDSPSTATPRFCVP